ncbi:TPA: hypothetical protein ACGTF6_004521, partial [Shigella sonnei]
MMLQFQFNDRVALSSCNRPPIRSRSKTLAALNKVVDDLIAGDGKLSITSVARAAGVTPGLIHN